MSELEPLDDDILDLVAAAKIIPEVAEARKASILDATRAKIGPMPPGSGSDTGSGLGSGPGAGAGAGAAAGAAPGAGIGAKAVVALLATFAVGVLVGIAVDRAITPAPPTASTAATIPAAPASATSATDAGVQPVAVVDTVSLSSLPDAPRPSTAPAASASARATASSQALSSRGLAAERALLDVARSALARGEAAEALDAAARHGREYPDGALTEEREAIAVKALVALGRKDEARVRVRSLEQRFPGGLSVGAAKAAVETAP